VLGNVIGIPMLPPAHVKYEQGIQAQAAEMVTAEVIVGVHGLLFLSCC
jgi:uncharacterized ferredoxin-like protein